MVAWRKEFFAKGPLTADDVMEDMKHGIVYFCGRDFSLRPCLVIRANRIPKQWYANNELDRFIRLLVFNMEYLQRYMFVPSRVENITVLIDLNGMGITDVPMTALKDVYKILNSHYGGRLYRLYNTNHSWMLKPISSAVMALVTDRQRQKLCIVTSDKEMA